MAHVFVGDIGTEVRLYCAPTLDGAVNPTISVKKPNGEVVEWPAQVDVGTLVYFTQANDLAVKGEYRFQARPNLPSWQGRGETAVLRVYDPFEV